MFGDPNTGVHTIRGFDIAVVDVLFTLIFAVVIGQLIGRTTFGDTCMIFGILVVISIPVHKLFCVKTTLTHAIG